MKPRIVVVLKDGRIFDVSDLRPDELVPYLRARGVTSLDDIQETRHYIRALGGTNGRKD